MIQHFLPHHKFGKTIPNRKLQIGVRDSKTIFTVLLQCLLHRHAKILLQEDDTIMETFKTMTCRKSVRSYKSTLSDANLQKILMAAQAAPIGMGKYDTMHMTVIRNTELLQELDRNAAEFFGDPSRTPLYNAPCLVVISTPIANPAMANVPYSNAAMMAEHMCLLATDLGIGSCNIWGAIAALNTKPELVAKLGLPEGHVPCCAVTLGDTDDTFAEREIPADRIAVSYIN